ncbi:hypothetical protein ACWCQ1_35930 [Streptomyces sp. NPDC002144]
MAVLLVLAWQRLVRRPAAAPATSALGSLPTAVAAPQGTGPPRD